MKMKKSFVSFKRQVEHPDGKRTSFSMRWVFVPCVMSVTGIGLFAFSHFLAPPPGVRPATKCELVGKHKSIPLEDGSNMEVNSDACFSVEYSADRRVIKLVSGEAIFRVKHDPSRPFVVKTGATSIVDVGTYFDAYSHDGKIRVVVIEGRVEIYRTSGESLPSVRETPVPIDAGHQIELHADGDEAVQVKPVKPEEISDMTAWVNDKIVENRLGDFLTQFRRYYRNVEFEPVDPAILDMAISGRYSIEDLPAFLGALQRFCVSAESRLGKSGGHVVTLARIESTATGPRCQ